MTQARTSLSLADIEGKAKNYRTSRDLLGDRVRQLTDQLDAAKRAAEPLIRLALQAAKAAESELSAAIADNVQLFKKPKTQIFHAVKVGIEKGKGKVEIADIEVTLRLIEKHLAPQAELLIKTKKTPIKSAIQGLTGAELKKIGVSVTEAGDQVVIRPVDSELDKMLDALLKTETTSVEDGEDE